MPHQGRTVMFSRKTRRSTLGPVPYALLLVTALVFGLSVALATVILVDDLELAAGALLLSFGAAAVFVGAVKGKERTRLEVRKHRKLPRAEHTGTASARTWWQVLEITEQATLDEVKAAYRAKVKQYHPDRVVNLAKEFQELAERKMKEINQAYALACRIKSPAPGAEN